MEGTLYDQLQGQAARQPTATALWHWPRGSRTPIATTYAALAERAHAFASAFVRQDTARAIIPILTPKCPDTVAAMLGALGAGRAFASLHRKLKGPQLASIFNAIGPTTAILDGPALMTLADDSAEDTGLPAVRWRVLTAEPLLSRETSALERLQGQRDVALWQWKPATVLPPLVPDASRAGCCLFTSGSTGDPKGVVITEADLRARAASEAECYGLQSHDVLLNILPFSFDVGLNQLFSALHAGCSIVLMDSWLPADIARTTAELGVTGISAVPSIWGDMLNAGISFDTAGAHHRLRYITVSGGDLPGDRLDRLHDLAPGVGIFKTYGQSETFRSTLLHPRDFRCKPTSVGRPFGSARVYVMRPDGSRCSPGEKGEIVHTGLGTMLGYLGDRPGNGNLRANPFYGPEDPAATAVFTGDIGWLDEDGFLFVSGRRDAMVKVSGNRVYPREVAKQILALAGVQQAEVVAVTAADGATQLMAFVVLSPGGPPTAALRASLNRRLPPYMLPKEMIPLPEVPRTPSGKSDYPALLAIARDQFHPSTVIVQRS